MVLAGFVQRRDRLQSVRAATVFDSNGEASPMSHKSRSALSGFRASP